MIEYYGGKNSDTGRSLKSHFSTRREAVVLGAKNLSGLYGRLPYRPWLLLGCLILVGLASQVTAQSPRDSGFSSPNSASKSRKGSTYSNGQDALPTREPVSGRAPLRQMAGEVVDDDGQPANVSQLDEPIAEVLIEGNSTIPNSEIAKHIKIRDGRPVTPKQIKEDVDALVRLRWFASVEPMLRHSDDGLVLVFRVIERPIVRRVEYKGLKKIKRKVFDSLTQLKTGSPFDLSANRECARRIEEYYHEKGFAFATVELEKGNDRNDREVVFLINEGPKVHVESVSFDGNKEFMDGILKTKTRTKTRILWLFGGKYDPSTIKDDIEGVKQYYHALGYFDVDIKPRVEFNDTKSVAKIRYTVSEGMRSKIRNIEVAGNSVLSEEDVREMIKVSGGSFYAARDINKDVETIKSKYGEQGRLFCRVDAVPHWTEEDGVVDIEYKIDEDKVYRIRNINVHILGDHPHTKTTLVRNIATIQPGDLADPKRIHLFKRRLEGSQNFNTGQGAGPGESGVRIETNVVKNDTWIDKREFEIVRSQTSEAAKPVTAKPGTVTPAKAEKPADDPGRPSAMGTGPFGMRGWLGTKESRAESRDPFIQIASRFEEQVKPLPELKRQPKPIVDDHLSPLTPIFRAQNQEPLQPPDNFTFDNRPLGDPFGTLPDRPDPGDWRRLPPPEFVDLDTYVSEARTGRLMFGVGVNSNTGLVGNIVLSEQNFDILRPPTSFADIINGTAWRGGGQKFKIEAMPGTQVSRYLIDWQDPYFMDTNFNLGVSGYYSARFYRNWSEDRTGGRVRLGRQLTQRWSASAALRLEEIDLFNPTLPSPKILTDAVGANFLSTVRASIIHDTRDAAFNSSQGHYFELSYEQAFGQFNYPRFEVEGRQYFTTYQRVDGQGRHTFMLSGQTSWSGNQTPIFERFFAGGYQNFRGFAFRGVSPVDTGVYVGGTFMMLGTAEYQMPLTANEMIKLVGFSDFGTVNNTASLSDFRLSVGAGFRVSIPMMGNVPIALDFAIPVIRDTNDIQQVFSFYMGMNR